MQLGRLRMHGADSASQGRQARFGKSSPTRIVQKRPQYASATNAPRRGVVSEGRGQEGWGGEYVSRRLEL